MLLKTYNTISGLIVYLYSVCTTLAINKKIVIFVVALAVVAVIYVRMFTGFSATCFR